MASGIVLCNYDSMSTSGKSAFTAVRRMLLNIAALAVLILFGCHNPFMFNQSTLVLGYLLLYGYDVTGKSYQMRLAGNGSRSCAYLSGILSEIIKTETYKRKMKDIVTEEFDLSSSQDKMAAVPDTVRTG